VTDVNLRPILEDIQSTTQLSDYEATEVLWVTLVKLGNLLPESNEHRRMLALVRRMPAPKLLQLVGSQAVDALLTLDPPLETILGSPHERLDPTATLRAFASIRSADQGDPYEAAVSLGEVLKRIRNKRAHGFKTRSGPRDQEILRAARLLLAEMCQLAIGTFSSESSE
jgi:hypothetical protein